MEHALSYVEIKPGAELAPWVACFWQISGNIADGAPFIHRVLPDGCADLLIYIDAARAHGGTAAELVGPMTEAQLVELRGPVETVGVRLRPGVIGAFAEIAGDDLLDTAVPLPELPAALHVNVAELADAPDLRARISLLARVCRARVASLARPDAIVGHALKEWSNTQRPLPTVSVLTRDIGLSERAFERRFVAQVGLTPVRYRRLARFRRTLRLHASGMRDWAELAATMGFTDQSHLVRDWRAFTGLTPTAWASAQAERAGFIQDGLITAF